MKINYKKIFFYILFALGYVMLLKLIGTGTYTFLSFLEEIPNLYSVVTYLILSIIIYVILVKLKLVNILKEKGNGFWYGIKVGALVVFFGIVVFSNDLSEISSQGQLQPILHILIFIIDMLLLGFTEEVVFRGIIQNKMYECFDMKTKKGIYLAIICSGLIFGSCHILNVFSGISFPAALKQTIGVCGMGMYFSAIYYRCKNIYALIFLHAFNDFASLAKSGMWGIGTETFIIENSDSLALFGLIFYFALTLFLLRKSKLPKQEKPQISESSKQE